MNGQDMVVPVRMNKHITFVDTLQLQTPRIITVPLTLVG